MWDWQPEHFGPPFHIRETRDAVWVTGFMRNGLSWYVLGMCRPDDDPDYITPQVIENMLALVKMRYEMEGPHNVDRDET
jgi:hypothetical protein